MFFDARRPGAPKQRLRQDEPFDKVERGLEEFQAADSPDVERPDHCEREDAEGGCDSKSCRPVRHLRVGALRDLAASDAQQHHEDDQDEYGKQLNAHNREPSLGTPLCALATPVAAVQSGMPRPAAEPAS